MSDPVEIYVSDPVELYVSDPVELYVWSYRVICLIL